MNEADKERYFREKEAYERITGQVLPVAKVVRKHLQFRLFPMLLRRLSLPLALQCKTHRGPPGDSKVMQLFDLFWF